MGGRGVWCLVLVLSVSLYLSHAVLQRESVKKDTRHFVKRPKPGPVFHPSPGLRKKLTETKPFTYPSSHIDSRYKRSDDEASTKCGLKPSALLETDPVSPYIY